MRSITIIFICVGVMCVLMLLSRFQQNKKDSELQGKFCQVNKNMSQNEVVRLLGAPTINPFMYKIDSIKEMSNLVRCLNIPVATAVNLRIGDGIVEYRYQAGTKRLMLRYLNNSVYPFDVRQDLVDYRVTY